MAEMKKVVTPVFRASYTNIFQAQPGPDGGAPKFGLSAIWTPGKFSDADKKRWKKMKGLLDEVSKEKFKKAWKDLPANIKRGLRDGMEREDDEGYGQGTYFASLTSKMKPGVVDADRNPISEDDGNADEIYPGCYCRATVVAYAYDNQGKGVALGINNLQKVKDGPRLDNRTDASEDFDDDIPDEWLEEGEEEEEEEEEDPLG